MTRSLCCPDCISCWRAAAADPNVAACEVATIVAGTALTYRRCCTAGCEELIVFGAPCAAIGVSSPDEELPARWHCSLVSECADDDLEIEVEIDDAYAMEAAHV